MQSQTCSNKKLRACPAVCGSCSDCTLTRPDLTVGLRLSPSCSLSARRSLPTSSPWPARPTARPGQQSCSCSSLNWKDWRRTGLNGLQVCNVEYTEKPSISIQLFRSLVSLALSDLVRGCQTRGSSPVISLVIFSNGLVFPQVCSVLRNLFLRIGQVYEISTISNGNVERRNGPVSLWLWNNGMIDIIIFQRDWFDVSKINLLWQ